MLITCPRCGFNQPKDRYCAKCGLDIDNYSQPKKSFLGKFADNAALQLFLVFLIALVTGFYVYKNNRNEIQDRVAFFNKGIQYNKNINNSTAPVPQQAYVPPPPPPEVTADASTVKPTTLAKAVTTDGAKSQVNVQYAEIPQRTLIDVIYNEARQSGQFNSLGDHVSGIWPQGKKKIANLKGVRWIGKESKKIERGRTVQFFAGIHGAEPENDLGLTTYLEVAEIDANALNANLEIVRSWRDLVAQPEGTIQRRFYPAVIELPPDSYFFLAGALPRDQSMASDLELTNVEPFKVLKTNTFRSGETEFVILIDFDK